MGAATLSGLAFGFGGFLMAQVPNLNIQTGAVWLPLILSGLIQTTRQRRWPIAMLAGLPLALYGTAGNFVPYKLTGRIARWLAPDRTKVHSFQLVVGAALFVPWYALLLYLVNGWFGVWGAVATAATLPAAGLFAREYGRRMKNRRRMMRLDWLELQQGVRLNDLRQHRRRLVRELDAALVEYLRSREQNT